MRCPLCGAANLCQGTNEGDGAAPCEALRAEAVALLREWIEMDNERDTDTRSISRRSERLIAKLEVAK